VTIELTICSMLLIIPLSLLSGILAGSRKDKFSDFLIRALSMIATYIPLFVIVYLLLAIFYVGLGWASLINTDISWIQSSEEFHAYTGMTLLDGLLNSRLDVTLMALRRLALPFITVTASQWAFL
jgi:ABC-type dipeptide/oligopeptide/nickel transport system permease component